MTLSIIIDLMIEKDSETGAPLGSSIWPRSLSISVSQQKRMCAYVLGVQFRRSIIVTICICIGSPVPTIDNCNHLHF